MAEKITELTPEQEARLVEFKDEWLAIGLSTEPAKRRDAEEVIAAFYAAIGKPRPHFVWGRSPLECQLQMHAASQLGKHSGALAAALTKTIGGLGIAWQMDSSIDQTSRAARDSLYRGLAVLERQITAQLVDAINSQLGEDLTSDTGTRIADRVDDLRGDLALAFLGQATREVFDRVLAEVRLRLASENGKTDPVAAAVDDQVKADLAAAFAASDGTADQALMEARWRTLYGAGDLRLLRLLKDQLKADLEKPLEGVHRSVERAITPMNEAIHAQLGGHLWLSLGDLLSTALYDRLPGGLDGPVEAKLEADLAPGKQLYRPLLPLVALNAVVDQALVFPGRNRLQGAAPNIDDRAIDDQLEVDVRLGLAALSSGPGQLSTNLDIHRKEAIEALLSGLGGLSEAADALLHEQVDPVESIAATIVLKPLVLWRTDTQLAHSLVSRLVLQFDQAIAATARALNALIRDAVSEVLTRENVEYRLTWRRGQHEAYWIAYYLFAREIGVEYPEKANAQLDHFAAIAKSCGWWWSYPGVCFVSDRPAEVHMPDGRLHCTDGPAVRYRDGWSYWAIDGVRVDEQIVMRPETQTLEQIRGETNLEVKRLRIARFGWGRYLAEAGAVVLDRRMNDCDATKEVLYQHEEGQRVLVTSCPGTGRIYALEVDPAVATCEEAQAWLSAGLAGRTINTA